MGNQILDQLIELESQALGLANVHDDFLHGHCHVFAIALQRVAGCKLGAVLDVDEVEGLGNITCLVHAYALLGTGGVDIRGYNASLALMAADFPQNEAWFQEISEFELLQLGEGVSTSFPDFLERVERAEPVAKVVWERAQQQLILEGLAQ